VKREPTLARKLAFYAVLAAFVIILAAVLWNIYSMRSTVRWLVWSQRYKSEVLAQRSAKDQLQHIECDGWGMAGQDTTVYLVFDPTDSLSTALTRDNSSEHHGVPCAAAQVHRLERQWYAVQFYTNESWGGTNALKCTGS
jgi:hypothetical protein